MHITDSQDTTLVVTALDNALSGCSKLTNVPLQWVTDTVTTMSSMLNGCSGLISISFGDLTDTTSPVVCNTSNVTQMVATFMGCSSLTELDLSVFDTTNVAYIISMFQDCSSLETLVLGKNFVTTSVTSSVGFTNIFTGCDNLHTIKMYNSSAALLKEFPDKTWYVNGSAINVSLGWIDEWGDDLITFTTNAVNP